MANNDDLILRGKALRDLRGIKDVLLAQGDPFLAAIMNRAITCIENQPAAVKEPDHVGQVKNLSITDICIDADGTVNMEMTVRLETIEPIEWWQSLSNYQAIRAVAYKLEAYLCEWLGGKHGQD